jgi:two-component system chemotaxis sensor kinase CheA
LIPWPADRPEFFSGVGVSYDETILRIFTTSCLEQLAGVESQVLALEQAPEGELAERVNRIFRAVHTIKGDAGVLDLKDLTDFAHNVESALNFIRKNRMRPTREAISALLAAFDALAGLVRAVGSGTEQPAAAELAGIVERLCALDTPEGSQQHSGLPHVEPEKGESGQTVGLTQSEGRVDRITVTAEQMDLLAQRIGELTMAHARLSREIRSTGTQLLMNLAEEMGESCRRIQEQTLEMRLIPVGILFEKLRRLVRDLGSRLGKEVELVTRGENTGIDMSVVEQLNGPLVHIVRNALDHGIEPPQERLDAGKPRQGKIEVGAEQNGRDVSILIQDDGRGIDVRALLQEAGRQGILNEDETMSPGDLLQLVFVPGLSSKKGLDEISGRGVGMDSVRGAMQAVRGSVRVDSSPGKGTDVVLEFPLSLAVVECLGARVGRTVFFMQLESIVECLDQAGAGRRTGTKGYIDYRGGALPLLNLSEFYGLSASGNRAQIVVVKTKTGLMGVLVDEIMGQSPALFQDLSRVFKSVPGVHGTSVMDDGRLGIILDLDRLFEQVMGLENGRSRQRSNATDL